MQRERALRALGVVLRGTFRCDGGARRQRAVGMGLKRKEVIFEILSLARTVNSQYSASPPGC